MSTLPAEKAGKAAAEILGRQKAGKITLPIVKTGMLPVQGFCEKGIRKKALPAVKASRAPCLLKRQRKQGQKPFAVGRQKLFRLAEYGRALEITKTRKEKEGKLSRQIWRGGNMLYPVPAVMVACQRIGERPNIITIAWAGTICSDPAMISISVRPERYSYDIIRDTGEFTVNLVTPELTYAADYCGVCSGRAVDKFAEMKLTAIPSEKIQAPGIGESPVILECRVTQRLELGTHHMFLAEIVAVSVDSTKLDEAGKLHLNSVGLVAYSHGEYIALGEKLGRFGYSLQKSKKLDKGRLREKSSGIREKGSLERREADIPVDFKGEKAKLPYTGGKAGEHSSMNRAKANGKTIGKAISGKEGAGRPSALKHQALKEASASSEEKTDRRVSRKKKEAAKPSHGVDAKGFSEKKQKRSRSTKKK